jgi:hypothetical protein
MIFIRSLIAGVCLLTYGCASTYQVPESTEKARLSLDAAGAEVLLVKALGKSDSAYGLCGSNVNLDRTAPSYVDLKNGVMIFEELDKKNRDAAVARDFPSLDRRRGRFEFDFKSVSHIRVLAPGVVSPICARSATNRQLGIKDGDGMFINVDLGANDFDSFVAALLFYSPKARLAEGFGL